MSTLTADAKKLKSLNSQSGHLSDRVYASLKAAILSLDFEPGAVLRKGPICEALGVSRTPVADAILKLEADRLVEVIPQSATRVSKMSMKEIREDAFLREALEVAAVEYAAVHCAPDLIEVLEQNLIRQEALLKSGDYTAFFETDQAFHNEILACCKIERLHDTISFVSNHMDRARLMLLPAPGRSADTIEEHRHIMRAIANSDPEAARSAMQTHLRQLIKRLEPLEKTRPELFAP
ncbi:MAG: GntR family transcriptional regulator [Paracoccaceae bacterium]